MRVADVLTWGILSVRPDDSLDSAVQLMLDKHVSGLPVIDRDGTLLGIVTEADFLRRSELGTEKHRSRWLEFLVTPGQLADEYTQSHARRVADVMSQPAVTIELDAPLSEAVDVMTRLDVKRLPVMSDGRAVGILSRADVLRALSRILRPRDTAPRPEADVRRDIDATLAKLPFQTGTVEVSQDGGVVRLTGAIMDDRERNAIRVAIENIAGVESVRDDLVWISPMETTPWG